MSHIASMLMRQKSGLWTHHSSLLNRPSCPGFCAPEDAASQTSLPPALRSALLAALLPGWRRASSKLVWPALLLSKAGSCAFRASSPQHVLHILIKVPPWAGRASDRWLQSEVQGCSGVKHGIRGGPGECVGSHLWRQVCCLL